MIWAGGSHTGRRYRILPPDIRHDVVRGFLEGLRKEKLQAFCCLFCWLHAFAIAFLQARRAPRCYIISSVHGRGMLLVSTLNRSDVYLQVLKIS